MKCVRKRSDGQPCTNWAIRGGTVCSKHGGASPKVRAKAAVRAELAAWRLDDATEDPGEVLLRLVTQSAARARFYGLLLERAVEADSGEVEADGATVDLPHGVRALIGHKHALTKDGDAVPVEEAIRGLVQLEADERDRCAGFAAKAVAAGLAERQVRIAERMVDTLATVVRDALGAADLDEPTRRVIEGVVVSRLLELGGAA